jgi:polyisoprenoid-binding protein YceI
MASISAPASLTTGKIDPAHTVAEFKVKHMMIANVKGTIKGNYRRSCGALHRRIPLLH